MQSVWGWVAARLAVVAVCFFAVFAIAGSAYAAPQISGISPTSGPLAGGNTITITGADLQSVTSINFGGVPSTDFIIDSATQITATVPAGLEGYVAITLSAGAYTTEPSEQGQYGYVSQAGPAPAQPTVATNPAAYATIASGIAAVAGTTYAVIHNAPADDQAPPAAPVVTAVSPAIGLVTGGMTVTITGSGFTGVTAVSFGAIVASDVQFVDDTTLTVTAPAGATGVVDVTVTTPGGTSAISAADHFTYYVPPVITGASPSSGPAAGGTTVTLTGFDFIDVTSVTFDGVEATSFTVDGEGQITAVTPAGAAGTVDVMVTNVIGYTTLPNGYTYVVGPVVSGVSPASGPEAGGTSVTITGSDFTGATAVSFGGTPAPSFTFISDSTITAAAPAGTGTVDVAVTTTGGTSAISAADQFTYFAMPTITNVSPTAGPDAGGTSVTINGTNFTGATGVTFGGTPATSFTVDSSSTITAVAPAGSPSAVDIAVTTPGGSATAVGAFSYIAAPEMGPVSPNVGPEAGGTTVTITGIHLANATAVTFGGAAGTITANTPTSLTVLSPAGTDTVDVVVTTPGGTDTKAGGFTYAGVPAVASLSPNEGPTSGGQTITVSGSGFTGVTDVAFGGTPAADFTFVSDSQITAMTPAGVAGAVDVQVTTPGGTSAVVPGGQFTYVDMPTITTILPTSGPLAGGTSVTISGSNLSGTTSVLFDTTPAIGFTVVNATTLTATAPVGATAGAVDVVVTTPGGSATAIAGYTYIAPPGIAAISPGSGSEAGNTTVTITGVNFGNAFGVTFGGFAGTITANTPTSLTVLSPAGTGTVDVVVTTPGGSDTKTGGFTYAGAPVVTSLSATKGGTAGGETITINGSGFTDVLGVSFGLSPASDVTFVSDSQITAVSPGGISGTVDVTVTTPGGTSAISAADQYTFFNAPTFDSVSPSQGPLAGGASVTLTGSGFTGASSVSFGSDPAASFVVDNDGQITATTPVGSGAGAVDVVVTGPGGSATSIAGYTYLAAPEIATILPASGSEAGNTTVTINGVNLSNATSAKFGSADGVIIANTPTSITVVNPAGTGTVDVLVITPAGFDTKLGGFTYVGPPVVTSLSATQGGIAGGETITINGSGFTDVLGVSFGLSPASNVTFVSDSQITAVSPGGVAGTVDVTVTTPGGTSAISAADQYTFFNIPNFASVSPSQGPLAGGASVTLTGSGFTGASGVSFGADPAASFVVDNDEQITATTPAGSGAGAVDVVVTGPGGSATATAGYTYIGAPTITDISPTSGTTAGGTQVEITGTGLSGVTSVTFGGAEASITASTPTSTTVLAPAGAAGAVDVVLTTPGGSATSAGGYTYAAAAPVVTGISPAGGPEAGGTLVTITGSGFLAATGVNFGVTAGTGPTVVSDTEMVITAPAASGGPGMMHITVTAPSGTSATVTEDIYTYYAAPEILSILPEQGSSNGGDSVTITGSGIGGATAVTFGGVPVSSFTVIDASTISVTTPAGTAGPADVEVIAPGGSSTLPDGFTYMAAPEPFARTFGPLGLGMNGTVTIKQVTVGGDGVFTFTSSTTDLNLSVTTNGGAGQSAPVSLTPGDYTVTAAHRAGFGVTSITCDDDDSVGDLGGQRASITLAAGENVSCTFTSFASEAATTGLIQDFLTAQGSVILANLPGEQRRIDRLNEVVDVPGNPAPVLMGYLPQAAEGTLPLPTVSASLAEIDAITGKPKSALDAWFQATLGTFGSDSLSGRFGIVSLGADYLLSPDILVGAFLQVDVERDATNGAGGTISGTGWLAGPYATIRFADNVYLDLLAGAGRSSNSVSPDGTYTDDFDATRWLVSGSLTGQWQIGDWTFLPTASLSYFQSTSEAYVDGLGVDIPSVTGGLGQATLGPKVSYSFDLGDGIHVRATVGLDGVLEVATDTDGDSTTNIHGRAHVGVDFAMPGGGTLGVSGTYDGIGSPSVHSTSGRVNFSVPIN